MIWLKRVLKTLLISLLTLIFSIALMITLFFSQPHLHQWLFGQLDGWTDGMLSVASSEGHIFKSIQLHGVALRHPALDLDIDRLEWSLDLIHLWYGRFTLDRLQLDRLQMVLHEQPDSAPTAPNPEPFAPLLGIPLLLELDALQIGQLQIQRGEQLLQIDNLQASLAWQLRRLVLKQLRLDYRQHQLQARGQLSVHDAGSFSGRLALAMQSTSLPDTELTLRWQGGLQQLALELDSQQPLRLRSQHQLSLPQTGPTQLRSQWQELAYALGDTLSLHSPEGESVLTMDENLQLEAKLHWQLDELPLVQQALSLQFDFADRLDLSAQSRLEDGSQLDLSAQASLHEETLRAELDSQLALANLLPTLAMHYQGRAALQLMGFDDPQLALQLSDTRLDWPERDASLHGALQIQASQLLGETAAPRLAISLQDLQLRQGTHQASLNGPLLLQLIDAAAQRFALDSQALRIRYLEQQALLKLRAEFDPRPQLALQQFELRLGDNQLDARGEYDESLSLQLQAHLGQLAQLLPELSGSAQLDARLEGPINALHATLGLRGTALGYGDFQLDGLSLDTHTPLAQPLHSEIQLLLQPLHHRADEADDASRQQLFSLLRLTRRASEDGMDTELSLQQHHFALQLALHDALSSLEQPRLTLRRLQLDHAHTGPWALQQPAAMQWLGGHQLRAAPICLAPQRAGDDARLCLQADETALRWDWQALPVFAWLAPLLPENLSVQGLLDGQGELQLGENLLQDWQLRLSLGSPQLAIAWEEESYRLPLGIDAFKLQLQADASRASLESQARLNQDGSWQAQLRLDNPSGDWMQAALGGALRAELNSLELPDDLLNLLAIRQQRIVLHSALAGSLAAPEHHSQAELDLLSDLPLLGLVDQQLQLRAKLDSDGLQAEGSLQQPEQRGLHLHAQLTGLQQGQPEGLLRIDAEDLQLIDSHFASLRSASALELRLQDQALQLGGELRLHHSRIDLQRVPLQNRISPSRDEVILDASGQPVPFDDGGLPLHLDLNLAFGDEVLVLLRDVQAYLGGALRLRQTPGEDLRGHGQVWLERGHIQLDPRNRIQIDRSAFSFTGTLANPSLDVQLSRRVDPYQTQLNITGTATQPQFVFYSTPSLSQGNIINLMIFGRAVDVTQEPNYESQLLSALYKLGLSGNTPVLSQITTSLGIHDVYFDIQDEQSSNLILGRALSKRLYIRYAMGLSEQQSNAVQLFYQLSRRWSLESLSGDDRQALDLIWSHER
ncbi:MAG: translocation/assembly module TamB domain-containing protein [Gammaproteobacteria bacterium]|nr:translocation/assembly module TamB domain-containing protein [Gammaproteobacteria bacterium]